MENEPPKQNTKEGKEKIDLRILLADDNYSTRELTALELRLEYSLVETVSDGKALLEKLLEFPDQYDFVITDYNMPKMNGLEVLRRMHAVPNLKDIPVVMASAEFNYEPIKKEAESLGTIFLLKPFDMNDLYKAIEKLRLKKK